ncbi:MAG TPA: ADOP family duplicated permease [Vicinamibacterales bacterium]|nr:ADOP family duplicated permease [Vicinamibacterales bacterium]
MTPRPPRLVEWLMRVSLGPDDRQAVLGDLYEECRIRVERDGQRAARRWCWRQLFRSFLPNLRRRRFGTDGLGQDLRHAVRSLRATPTFTLVALVVLTLGVGATTAIFSVVDGVALRGVPFPRGNRVVLVTEPRQSGRGATTVSAQDFEEWRREQTAFEDLGASQGSRDFVIRDNNASETLRTTLVSANLFRVLRASPSIGRTFTAQDEIPGNEHVLILSDAFWRRRFGADPNVLGRTIAFETGDWMIVGVMPASFMYQVSAARPMDLWVPWVPDPKDLQRGRSQSYNLTVIGRLKDGVSVAQAQADLDGIMTRVKAQYAASVGDRVARVAFLQDAIVGSAKSWMLMLLGSVTFVLLIACVNVANLMLARASARSRDVAVRSALGASRWRIVRGLLAESLVLSVVGTALGVGLAIWCVELLRASLPGNLPRINEVAVNYRVLLAAAIAAVAVTIGITPVWQSSPPALGVSLRESGRSGNAGASRQRVRTTLLVAEVALAVILLVGSGLFISSFVRIMRVDLGFDLDNVLSVDVISRRLTDADMPRTSATVAAVVDQVRRIPGLEAVALAWGTQPLVNGNDRTTVTVPGRPAFDQPDDYADEKYITPDYFKVLRVPVVRGRAFTDLDAAPGAPQAVILNDVAAARYFGSADPVGITVAADGDRTVVGIVRSTRLQGPEGDLRPEVYVPLNWQHAYGSPLVTLMMRTSRDPASFIPTIRAAIRTAAPDLVVADPQTYEDRFGRIVAQRKFNMIVLALFGLLAIAIAAAGIYGVMAYLVEQRTQEIGVRMALGAEPASVARMVLGRATVYMMVGLAVGLTGGWLLSRFVQAFLFKLDAHDPVVYASVAALLVATGLLASFIPARRAARVDPVVALRF